MSEQPIPPVQSKPWWQSATVLTAVLVALTAAPTIVNLWAPLFPPKVAAALTGTASLLAALAVALNRKGSQKRADVLLGALLDYVGEKDGPVERRAVEVKVKLAKGEGK